LNLKYDLAKNQISKKLLKICGMGVLYGVVVDDIAKFFIK